jgi:hypothetical protein
MIKRTIILASAFCILAQWAFSQASNVQYRKQGFSMRMALDNRGAFGKVVYPQFQGGAGTVPDDSMGLEYPLGTVFEHIFGAGIWVGGILDTSTSGPPVYIRGVTTGYEGWTGPFFEFFPGRTTADTIFRIFNETPGTYPGRYPPKPAMWDSANGLEGAFPYKPISDADFHSKYDDYHERVTNHVPLGLKTFQSSYAWDDTYADAIIILEYRIINNGRKNIDSSFVGFFFEADVGPTNVPLYYQHNFTGYYQDSRTGYVHNPRDRGSTPVGCTLLSTSRPLTELRYSFRWWPGPLHPGTDAEKYQRLASGLIDSNQSLSDLSDTRFLFGFGPFTIHPSNPPLPGITPDTLKIAVAVISGYDPAGNHLRTMQRNAARALDIYLNQGIRLPATPPSPPLRAEVGFRRIKLNWLWTPADSALRPNPVSNWDTTNSRAREHPTWDSSDTGFGSRISPPYPPGITETDSGGRNFESYRLWRSEYSGEGDIPDQSFTLLKQWDVAGDTIEFETGLEHEFIDSNLVRGKVYTYSVTSKSIPNLAYQQIVVHGEVVWVAVPVEALESKLRTNAIRIDLPFSVSQELGKVRVVPNPYRTDVDYTFESGGYEGPNTQWSELKRQIKFINLPERCTIRVFSLAGDLIRTIEHGEAVGGFPSGSHAMTLLSDSYRALASGIYLFTVESDLGTQVVKFVIIR